MIITAYSKQYSGLPHVISFRVEGLGLPRRTPVKSVYEGFIVGALSLYRGVLIANSKRFKSTPEE